MRNPGRRIWFYSALMLVGVALCALASRLVGRSQIDWQGAAAGALGISLTLTGFIRMIRAILQMRGQAKLRAGENVLARWSVTPDEWERFRTFDRIRAATEGTLANDLTYDAERPSQSVEIIVGRKSALIGDSYHVLRKGGLPALRALYWLPAPADPECLEFHVSYLRHRSTPVRKTLRFPVPQRFRAEGIRVFEHFQALISQGGGIAVRQPVLTIGVSLALAAVGATAFAWGASRISGGDPYEVAPFLAAIIGGIGGAGALVIALMTAILARRRA